MRGKIMLCLLVLGMMVATPTVAAEDTSDGELCIGKGMVEACVAAQAIPDDIFPGPCTCPPPRDVA